MMAKNKPSSNRKGRQPRKDNGVKRVNYDNTRISKFDKDMDRGPKDVRDTKRTDKSNDVSWYAANQEILKAAASIPFTDVTGTVLSRWNMQNTSVPGVLTMEWVPFMGGVNDPLNQAANQIFSDTVHANSRNQSYDASDEMLLILAGANVFAALAAGIRVYGLMRRYNQLDRYTPDALVTAAGFDPVDLRANFANMWFQLNQLIIQSTQIWIPNVMPLIQRWYWMNSNVYRDGSSRKSQYYMFVQAVYYQYDETSMKSGGSLKPVVWTESGGTKTWSEYVTMVQDMIDAMINSQDRGIIFGDILKAYGADRLYALGEITSDYIVEPIYDREVLTQIENATMFTMQSGRVGPVVQLPKNNNQLQHYFGVAVDTLSQGTGGYLHTFDYNAHGNKHVLNFHQLEDPTPEQIMVATRLATSGQRYLPDIPAGVYPSSWGAGPAQYFSHLGTALPNLTSGKQYVWTEPAIVGTEVVIHSRIYYYSNSDSGESQISAMDFNFNRQASETFSNDVVFTYNAFDWSPKICVLSANTVTGQKPSAQSFSIVYTELLNSQLVIADYDNFAITDQDTIQKMHTTAIYSEFGVRV